MGRAVLFSFLTALVVFCVVQDRITAAGAREYVARQHAALAGDGVPVTIEAIMQPAIAQSVRQASLASGAVLVAGLIGGTVGRRMS